jgi:protein-disulfide isomerase
MTSSPPKLARFSPFQMAGMALMVGAVLAGVGLFAFSRSVNTPEHTVIVNPAAFPHIGRSGQVVAVFEDVNCPHCREFQVLNMGRLTAAARAGKITLVDVQFPFLKDSSTYGAKMLRCTWKHAPNRYYPLRTALYRTVGDTEPLLGDCGR